MLWCMQRRYSTATLRLKKEERYRLAMTVMYVMKCSLVSRFVATPLAAVPMEREQQAEVHGGGGACLSPTVTLYLKRKANDLSFTFSHSSLRRFAIHSRERIFSGIFLSSTS